MQDPCIGSMLVAYHARSIGDNCNSKFDLVINRKRPSDETMTHDIRDEMGIMRNNVDP